MKLLKTLGLVVLTTGAALASDLDFVLVNKAGQGFRAVYVSSVDDKDWNGNLLKKQDVFEDGESLRVRFPKSATAQKWDVTIVSESGQPVTFNAIDLTEVDKVTLKNNSGVLAAVVD